MGRFWARCNLGFDLNTQVHHCRNEPGIVECCYLTSGLVGPSAYAQSPEQGGGCRGLPNFLDRSWFSRHQRMSAPRYRVLQKSLLSDCVVPGSARHGRQAATAGAIVADLPWRSGSYTSPLPQRQCSKTASFRATATAALSSHSSHPARRVAAHIVVSPCLVRMAPKYSARFPPAAGASSCPRLC